MSPNSRIWFVTGASSGFGRSITELLLKRGDNVVATLRKPEALSDLSARYSADRLVLAKLDVTKRDEVVAAFAKAKEAFGRIDVVFNNAGQYVVGEVEDLSEEIGRHLFDVNFWGAVNVTKEAVRFFREENKPIGGRLLQVSSRMGIVGCPSSGYYVASKFALEGLSESLIKELEPQWNIKVTIVEPGPFRTKIVQENLREEPQHPAYSKPESGSSRFRAFVHSSTFGGDADKFVAAVVRLVDADEAPVRLPLHKNTIVSVREKAQSLNDDADRYASWSDDLYFD
ncbi:hypothetical protein SERLA73DRAFT_74810 [Serpula lacrymans var. lacrymans S7.3]|uniref:NAD-P-binding protein n=2 Tax=Serpula lacrymans var. lacrymans TaxID=341189 RepID=F8Q3L1_SERL3|nr:uncharacterized protein SERLADRAFT_439482 [Serpula lacrymans var. lacrymans S7.9]EGN97096.1 hypothetical protein SERLA73DRAFT_74810 [Serpula lacrymans var. lacrymans S7.3]EGO22703.1 hypothetical protein SERLADRAFT_439482 [Serpula lacrymans var. lacrymans S7.9]